MNIKEYEKKQAKIKQVDEFIGSISLSWTWARLTEEEKEQFKNWLHAERYLTSINGTRDQRWNAMNNYYFMFLLGSGYGKDKRFEP